MYLTNEYRFVVVIFVTCVHFFSLNVFANSNVKEENNKPMLDQPYFIHQFENGTKIKVDLQKHSPKAATLAEAEKSMQFWFHPNGQEDGILIEPSKDETIQGFKPGSPVLVFCHGFTSDNKDFGNRFLNAIRLRKEWDKDTDFNVIVINWHNLALMPWYFTAVQNVGVVGTNTACMLRHLIGKNLTTLADIHFIGHSLGAHVGNYVGLMLNSKCGKNREKMGRITALDPAFPLFHDVDDSRRIDPEDATFVDVIHSAAGIVGFPGPRGHVDFYPNAGVNPQPGCPFFLPTLSLTIFLIQTKWVLDQIICSHTRAAEFFAESIHEKDAFQGCLCKDWLEYSRKKCKCEEKAIMGFGTSDSVTRGTYFLHTNPKKPFGMHATGKMQIDSYHPKPNRRKRLGTLAV